MKAIEFIQAAVSELDTTMIGDIRVLTQAQLAWRPVPKANPIGFLFWHCIRNEDNMFQNLRGKPSVWESEGWYKKFDMDPKAQGTGFQDSDVEKAAALPLAELLAYAERVNENTMSYLKSLDDAGLDRAPNPERPRWTVAMMVRNFIIAHGWWHLGEIKYLKGMQGMPAAR